MQAGVLADITQVWRLVETGHQECWLGMSGVGRGRNSGRLSRCWMAPPGKHWGSVEALKDPGPNLIHYGFHSRSSPATWNKSSTVQQIYNRNKAIACLSINHQPFLTIKLSHITGPYVSSIFFPCYKECCFVFPLLAQVSKDRWCGIQNIKITSNWIDCKAHWDIMIHHPWAVYRKLNSSSSQSTVPVPEQFMISRSSWFLTFFLQM